MESTKKFDCWEELSDEELASISGGLNLSAIGPAGIVTASADKNGLSTQTDGIGGGTKVNVGPGGVSYSGYDTIVGTAIKANV
ncbi:MAG: bacteriocin [Brasilonema angustatum HA4187-MV1]|nr:bacteriocin [Brasilonema angustatum HA4187-MV1]